MLHTVKHTADYYLVKVLQLLLQKAGIVSLSQKEKQTNKQTNKQTKLPVSECVGQWVMSLHEGDRHFQIYPNLETNFNSAVFLRSNKF